MQKYFTWGDGLQCKAANFLLLQSHAENPLPHFPQAVGPGSSPANSIPQPRIPTHVVQV
jgi:hypothetical protein